jgi:hypothetical protein
MRDAPMPVSVADRGRMRASVRRPAAAGRPRPVEERASHLLPVELQRPEREEAEQEACGAEGEENILERQRQEPPAGSAHRTGTCP